MKKEIILLIIIISIFDFKIFSQQASQNHFFIETQDNQWHQIEYKQKVKVYTKDTIFVGKLDSVSNNIIFLNENKINIHDTSIIKYKNIVKTQSILFFLSLSFVGIILYPTFFIVGFFLSGLFSNIAIISGFFVFFSFYSLIIFFLSIPTIIFLGCLLLIYINSWKSIRF